MRIHLVCHDNGWGLSRDAQVLCAALSAHVVRVSDPYDKSIVPDDFDANIFCELVEPRFFRCAKHQVVIPNAEWTGNWHPHVECLHIWCKTMDAHVQLSRFGDRSLGCHFLGFTSIDRRLPTIAEREFLHLSGKSLMRQTDVVVDAWSRHPEWPLLHVVRSEERPPKYMPACDNIAYNIGRLSDDVVQMLQNRCLYHLCTSSYEGFGHYINEALSCGAIVFVPAGPPMTELVPAHAGVYIVVNSRRSHQLVELKEIDREGLEEAVSLALNPLADLYDEAELRNQARAVFEERDRAFHVRLNELLTTVS